jgi:catechol 2,3-dioxygenase-like lactoylglutathione lyase family enzyme
MKLQHIDHVAINVSDLQRSIEWYRDVLGLERRFQDAWGEVPTMMCVGETCVALFVSTGPDQGAVAQPATGSLHHIAFRVDRDNFEAARQRFGDLGIELRSADHGIAQSVYVADPDGHRIEITTYDV